MKSKIIMLPFLAALIVASYWGYKKTKTPEKLSSYKQLERLNKKTTERRSHLVNTPDGQAYLNKNWIYIEEKLNQKNIKKKTLFLENSIHLIDHSKNLITDYDDNQKLYSLYLSFIEDNKLQFRGKNARALILSAQLIKKLVSPKKNSKNYHRVTSLLNISKSSKDLEYLILENTLNWKPLPTNSKSKIKKNIRNAEDSFLVKNNIQYINMLLDPVAKKDLIFFLYNEFSKLTQAVQPIAVKILVLNKHFLDVTTNDLLSLASKGSGAGWDEAYVFVLEKSPIDISHKSNLQKLYSTTSNPILRKKINNLIKKM